jgi:hypothetical protein
VCERIATFVFEPCHAVIRLEQIRPIEHVSVRHEHIVVTVAVEIDDLNAA